MEDAYKSVLGDIEMSDKKKRGPHGFCLECEARIEAAENMDVVPICSKCIGVHPNETIRVPTE